MTEFSQLNFTQSLVNFFIFQDECGKLKRTEAVCFGPSFLPARQADISAHPIPFALLIIGRNILL